MSVLNIQIYILLESTRRKKRSSFGNIFDQIAASTGGSVVQVPTGGVSHILETIVGVNTSTTFPVYR